MNSQKEKGKRYERKIAKFYRDLGFSTHRGLQSRDGNEAPDVVIEAYQCWIECKHYASGGLVHRAFEQASNDAAPGDTIIVHTHEDNGRHLVTVDLEQLGKILNQMLQKGMQKI